MSKNRKLRPTWVKVGKANVLCETVMDYGRNPKDGYWRKMVVVNGNREEVRCKQKRGTFEQVPEE